MNIKTTLLSILFFLSLKFTFAQSAELKTLSEWLAGKYTSREQHLKDTANYFDIRLQIIPIHKDSTNGYWYYVEQAVADYVSKPYRQRIYHLTEDAPGVFRSKIFTMKDPLRFTGKPELAEKLPVDSLMSREGCDVLLKRKDATTFEGSTDSKKCPSDRSGAVYATSIVTLTKDMLISWDQGFNEKDEQVWGATLGGYQFLKER